ncbi:hypothetical protein [Priestia megaterium]|uniref:hypothetical protein n=1 Tax=Priestia megaterium TaxID=1404 RepID=UPI000BFB236D|nr:hypothetical protein [Priestia megaterium]PGQ88335.1 hypothetical protein COA18_05240 [Priestia megaterium]
MANELTLEFVCTKENCEGGPNTPARYIGIASDENRCSDCFWDEQDIEVVSPPMEVTHLEIKPLTYILESVWKDEEKEVFYIHREMEEEEPKDTDKVFKYKGKTYLYKVAKITSKEAAMKAIHSWWRGCISLNQLNKKEKGRYEYI